MKLTISVVGAITICVALLCSATGCIATYVSGYVRVRNSTSARVFVRSTQSGDAVAIGPNEAKKLNHSSGNLVIGLPNHQDLEFSDIKIDYRAMASFIDSRPRPPLPG